MDDRRQLGRVGIFLLAQLHHLRSGAWHRWQLDFALFE